MPQKSFAPKEIIFREGDPSDAAYVILTGKVEILKSAAHGEILLATLEPGATFGEMGLLDDAPRSATARALEDTLVDIMPKPSFEAMVDEIPPPLNKVMQALISRLRVTNQRITQTEQAAVLLESDIRLIRVAPASEKLASILQPAEVQVARLPYRIGGYAEDSEPNRLDQNHLYIPSEGPPLIVSRNHCAIEIDNGQIVMFDRGSRFGTTVNGRVLGRGRGLYKLGLQMGENEIILGHRNSGYRLQILCE